MGRENSGLVNVDVFRQFTIQELARMVVRAKGGDDGMSGPVQGRMTDDVLNAIEEAEEAAAKHYTDDMDSDFYNASLHAAYSELADGEAA